MSLLHFFAFKYTNNSESLNCILKKGHTLTTKAKELFVKLFANKNVSTTYSPKNYTFQNLSKRNAFQSTFTFNGEDMSIVNYFSKHAIKLDYPQLPLALLKMKKFDEPIRLPLELLRVCLLFQVHLDCVIVYEIQIYVIVKLLSRYLSELFTMKLSRVFLCELRLSKPLQKNLKSISNNVLKQWIVVE